MRGQLVALLLVNRSLRALSQREDETNSSLFISVRAIYSSLPRQESALLLRLLSP